MNVMGIIFANDATMGVLTNKRTMGSLPFGGRYRQIDFHLSNMAAAGIRHIGVISRHNYQSLMNHIGSGEEWGLELEEGGLEFLTPYAMSTTDSYRGKLDNLNFAMGFLQYGSDDEYVIMADSAIVYNIDLTRVLAAHIASGKDITVVTKEGIANGAKQLDPIEMGDGIYGADAVAWQHFGRGADRLTRANCALIAATLPNPLRYSSKDPSSYILRRQTQIIRQMKNVGKVKFER